MGKRYSNKEKELVFKYAYDLEADSIQSLLAIRGCTRSIESIKAKIEEKKTFDRKINVEKAKAYANNNLAKYRANTLINGARTRARKKEIPFDLTAGWVVDQLATGKCAATGLSFVLSSYTGKGHRKTNPYAPSLDRINPAEGYTTENTQLVLSAFNKFKSDMAQYDIIHIAKAIVKSHMKSRRFTVNTPA